MGAQAMTRTELLELPATVDLETAGRALGIGRTAAYKLAKDGQFPAQVLQASPGAAYKVLTADIHRLLHLDADEASPAKSDPVVARMANGQLDRDLGELAADASRFANLAQQFNAGLIRREPLSGAASQLAQMAMQLCASAARIDGLRDAMHYLDDRIPSGL